MEAEVVNASLFHSIAKLLSTIIERLSFSHWGREDITFLEPAQKNFQSLANSVLHWQHPGKPRLAQIELVTNLLEPLRAAPLELGEVNPLPHVKIYSKG